MHKQSIIIAVIGLAVAGGTFFAGRAYGRSQSVVPGRGSNNAMMFNRGANGGMGGGGVPRGGVLMGGAAPTAGEIIAHDASSITVKLRDGGSKIVLLSASTTIAKLSPATHQDLISGTQVIIQGPVANDGTLTARSVQIVPPGASTTFRRF